MRVHIRMPPGGRVSGRRVHGAADCRRTARNVRRAPLARRPAPIAPQASEN